MALMPLVPGFVATIRRGISADGNTLPATGGLSRQKQGFSAETLTCNAQDRARRGCTLPALQWQGG